MTSTRDPRKKGLSVSLGIPPRMGLRNHMDVQWNAADVSGFINVVDHTRPPALGCQGRRRGRRSYVLHSKIPKSPPLKVGVGLGYNMDVQQQIMPCPESSLVARSARCP